MNDHPRDFYRDSQPVAICNVDGEATIIGSILMNNDAYQLIGAMLSPEHFYEPVLRQIYEVMGDMVRSNKAVNPITLKPFVEWNKKIKEGMTVQQMIARCMTEFALPLDALPTLAGQIKDMAIRRNLITFAQQLITSASDMTVDSDPKDLGEQAMSDIASTLSTGDEVYGAISFASALDDALDASNRAYSGKKGSGVTYRFPPIERLIGPFSGGQLIILGGATKQGKSALVGQLAMGAASEGFPVWFYSGEMTAPELAMRESSRETKISVTRQKRGKFNEADYERLMEYRNNNRDKPIYIQPKRLTLDMIEERVRHFVQKKGKGLIIIDHIGLVDRTKAERNMADWEFGQVVTSRLKQLARDLDCPVIGCAQLKKNTFNENRGPVNEKFLNQIMTRKPRYTDLIGAMERDADHVLIPFRPVVFLKEHEPLEFSDLYEFWNDMVKINEDKAQIVLALSRESQWPRHVDCGWNGPTTTFIDLGGMNEPELVKREVIDNPMGLL